MNPKWFFVLLLFFLLPDILKRLVRFFSTQEVVKAFSWNGWEPISAIALIAAAIAMFLQALSTKKLADAALIPSITVKIKSDLPQKKGGIWEGKKLGTRLFLHNPSNFPVWVWTKMELKIGGVRGVGGVDKSGLLDKPLLGEQKWQLFSHEGFLTNSFDFLYNFVEEIEGDLEKFKQEIKLSVSISYTSFANQKQKSDWIVLNHYYFDSDNFEWKNSLGIPDAILLEPQRWTQIP